MEIYKDRRHEKPCLLSLYHYDHFKADGLGRSVDYRLLDRDFPGQEPARDEQQHHSGRQVDNDRPYPQAHLG